MTARLEEQAARLLTVGFVGQHLTDALKHLLDRGVGGVILFGRNIASPRQVAELIGEIKRYAGRPLPVALDQEGGSVARLREGFTRIPAMRAVGASNDAVLAERVGRVLGRELRAVGVDWNFAPVLDVDTNEANPVIGNRSFARDPDRVARLGIALAKGLEGEGVASSGKHFPGHGDTSQDSHRVLPRLPHTLERLDAVELVPFRAAVEAGLASLMTAHVVFEAIDSELPATMSRPVLEGLLRNAMGYEGLVVSDDLEMRAITDHYGCERAAILGLSAGVDSFLCCHTAEVAHAIIEALTRAAQSGLVSEGRLEVAAERVRKFAARWARPPEDPRLEVLQCDEHLGCVQAVLEEGGAESGVVGEDPTAVVERMRLERIALGSG